MKVLKEKHFILGNFKVIAGLVLLLFLASVLFVLGRQATTEAILGVRIP